MASVVVVLVMEVERSKSINRAPIRHPEDNLPQTNPCHCCAAILLPRQKILPTLNVKLGTEVDKMWKDVANMGACFKAPPPPPVSPAGHYDKAILQTRHNEI